MGSDLTGLEITLIRGYLLILYMPISWYTFQRLFPRLLPIAKRLALIMLAAQALVILASLEVRSNLPFDVWLLHLNAEYNVQATLASIQLFLVSCVAFLSLRAACARKSPQCLILLGGGAAIFCVWSG